MAEACSLPQRRRAQRTSRGRQRRRHTWRYRTEHDDSPGWLKWILGAWACICAVEPSSVLPLPTRTPHLKKSTLDASLSRPGIFVRLSRRASTATARAAAGESGKSLSSPLILRVAKSAKAFLLRSYRGT